MRKPTQHRIWAMIGLAVTAFLALAAVVVIFVSNETQVTAWVERFGPWGPAAISVLEMAQAILAPIPGQAIEAVAGRLYGVWHGTLYAMAGLTIGSLISFGLSRRFGRPLAVRLAGPSSVARLDDLANRGGSIFFFLVWLAPFVPDDLACIAAGLTPMSTAKFLVLMVLGRLPGIFVATWAGAQARQIPVIYWIPLLLGLALLGLAFWRWGERMQNHLVRFLQRLAGGSPG